MDKKEMSELLNWFEYGVFTEYISSHFCKTRSDFNGRLNSYEQVLKSKFPDDCYYLISSSLGEIGNNCFDHNLGFWQDLPGCLFVREKNFCVIADRGRGIKNSLSLVYKLNKDEHSYIEVAFQKVITGRAPERRGNGLKYTKKNILRCKINLLCFSAGERIYIGENEANNPSPIALTNLKNVGTFTLVYW